MNHTPRTPEREPMTISVSDHLQTVFKQLIVENPNIRFGLERMHQTIREFVNEKLAADEPRIDAALKDIESLVSLRLQPKGAPAIPADQAPDFLAIHHELKKAAAIIRLKHEKGEVVWQPLEPLATEELPQQAKQQVSKTRGKVAFALSAVLIAGLGYGTTMGVNAYQSGDVHTAIGDLQEGEDALEWYLGALEKDPENAANHSNLAQYYSISNVSLAASHYEKAIALDPENSEYRMDYAGMLYIYNNDRKKALIHLKKAVELNPDKESLDWALKKMLETYFEADNYLGQLEVSKRLIVLGNNDQVAIYAAKACLELGDFDGAKKYYEQFLELGESNINLFDIFDAHSGYAKACMKTGDFAKAINAYKEALKASPNNADEVKVALIEAYTALAEKLMEQGSFEEAEQNYKAALKLDPKNFNLGTHLFRLYESTARRYDEQGEIDKAILYYKKATGFRNHYRSSQRLRVLESQKQAKQGVRSFEAEVLQAEKPVLVYFWATYCTPCKEQGPIVDQLKADLDWAKIVKIDTTKHEAEFFDKYRGKSRGMPKGIPHILIFRYGQVVANLKEGVRSAKELIHHLNKARKILPRKNELLPRKK